MSLNEEAEVREHSREFKKELGLRDLVLTQIMYVVGTIWVGTAAKLGEAQIVFWLLAILTFYLPQAVVVVHLNRRMPLEGGLYQWAKLGFNEFTGFMVAWNLWLYAVVLMASVGLLVVTSLSYAFAAPWMAESKWVVTLASCVLTAALVMATRRGLSLGKWVHNAGGLMLMAAFAVLIALPFVGLWRGTVGEYHPFAVALPALPLLLCVNIFSKMALGAFSGLEYVAILAGECRDPARSIGRAVVIATPFIALMFILGTSSVLAFVRGDEINLITPVPQVLTLGFGAAGWARFVAPVAILTLLGRTVANMSFTFTGNTRLPMVAGWDGLLPAWFSRLHPRYRTPQNSIFFVGVLILTLGLLGIAGVGHQEAFQLIDNAAGVFYAFAYLVMFALPVFGFRGGDTAAPLWLKLVSGVGFLVSLLYAVLTVVPIVEVQSPLAFSLKIVAVIVVANAVGAALYFNAGRRRGREAEG